MRCKLAVVSVALALWTSLPGAAHAQPPPGETSAPTHDDPAKRLFEEGRNLAKEGRYEEACPKLEESQRLRPGVGTLFNLADCNAKLGKTATAHRQFLEVAEKTAAEGEVEREKVAREKAAELEPRLMKVALSVASASASLEVQIDGRVIPREEFAAPIALDPGSHTIGARAPGEDPFSTTVELTEEGSVTKVEIPIGGESTTVPEEPKTYRKTGHLIAGSILTGLGAILLVTGVVALAANEELENVERDNAIVYGAIATPLGAVMLGPGIPLFISGLKTRPVDPAEQSLVEGPGLVAGASATWVF